MSDMGEHKKHWNPFGVDVWIAWLGATAMAVAGLTAFFYMNFLTKESFADYKESQLQIQHEILSRLNRIEDKLDRMRKR